MNATEFYGVHMLSGGQDGTICIWDAKRWECLVTLKAHKYPLLCGHSTRLEMATNSFLTCCFNLFVQRRCD